MIADHRVFQCRAKSDGCIKNRRKHFCRLCDENNSDHLSRNCPQASTLFHGTTADAVKNITEEGLKCSPRGCLGRGIYFVDNREYALTIARGRNPNNWAVLQCKVNLGPPVAGNQSPNTIERLHGTIGVHAPWAGITTDFMEYCLTNENRCNVVAEISRNGKFIIPIQSTALAKQPTVLPKQLAVVPKQPAVVPKQPTVVLRQPTVVPKQPTVVPKQPTVVPKQPAVVPKLGADRIGIFETGPDRTGSGLPIRLTKPDRTGYRIRT